MNSLKHGLVGYYPLNSGGATLYDMVSPADNLSSGVSGTAPGADNSSVPGGGSSFVTGTTSGQGMRGAGSSTSKYTFGSSAFTMLFWLKVAAPTNTTGLAMVCKQGASGGDSEIRIGTNAAGFLGMAVWDVSGTARGFSGPSSASSGVWEMYEAYYDPVASELGIGKNAGAPTTLASGSSGIRKLNGALELSGRDNSGGQDPFAGALAQLGIWGRRLTKGEVVWLYNDGRGRDWPLDGRPAPNLQVGGPGSMRRRNRLSGMAV